MTNRQWSTCVTRLAITHWFMVGDVAVCVISTNSRTRIYAFVSVARQNQRAI